MRDHDDSKPKSEASGDSPSAAASNSVEPENEERLSLAQTEHEAVLTLKSHARKLLDAMGAADGEDMALQASWPDPVLALNENERAQRVRSGQDTVILDGPESRRGFIRAVLRVPVSYEGGAVYGVFVEVERDAYQKLKQAYESKAPVRVSGKLATRLPLLESALGSVVEILEDGSNRRVRVVAAEHPLLQNGPAIGPI